MKYLSSFSEGLLLAFWQSRKNVILFDNFILQRHVSRIHSKYLDAFGEMDTLSRETNQSKLLLQPSGKKSTLKEKSLLHRGADSTRLE